MVIAGGNCARWFGGQDAACESGAMEASGRDLRVGVEASSGTSQITQVNKSLPLSDTVEKILFSSHEPMTPKRPGEFLASQWTFWTLLRSIYSSWMFLVFPSLKFKYLSLPA